MILVKALAILSLLSPIGAAAIPAANPEADAKEITDLNLTPAGYNLECSCRDMRRQCETSTVAICRPLRFECTEIIPECAKRGH